MSLTQDDYRVEQARQHHASAAQLSDRAWRLRRLRDTLVRELRESDRAHWTLARLGTEVGCSKELIAHIINCGFTWKDERNGKKHSQHRCTGESEHAVEHACRCGAAPG